jgi:hypothetical protein
VKSTTRSFAKALVIPIPEAAPAAACSLPRRRRLDELG